MITQRTITVNGKDLTVNMCDLQCEWVLVHNGVNALVLEKSQKSGILETINTIFEAASEAECENEVTRLNLDKSTLPKKPAAPDRTNRLAAP